MEPILIYLLKASFILALFYLCYQAFLKNETFFRFSRHFLILGILVAFTLPFVTITKYVSKEAIYLQPFNTTLGGDSVAITTQIFEWSSLIFGIYILGVSLLFIRFMVQIASLYKLVRSHDIERQGRYLHVKTNMKIAPFSFFNYIFYNPSLYSKNELEAIIVHEQVHSSQWHSLDVILSHFIIIGTWVNPFSWLYKNNIKQNLEFLADEDAAKNITSIKTYQYTLLKVSGNQFCAPIVNNFYNSLIKKRIVMLNKSKSDKRNIFKIVLVVPVLAIFLVSFNTKEVYIPMNNEVYRTTQDAELGKTIKINIDKDTSDSELEKIKTRFAEEGVDFSYTVVHNANKEIIEISIDLSSKKENGKTVRSSSTFNNGDDPIDPLQIGYDDASNSFFMGNASMVNVHEEQEVHEKEEVHEDQEVHIRVHTDTDKKVWVHTDGAVDDHKTIEIIDKNGKETILINGKKVSRKAYDKMKKEGKVHGEHIKIRKHKGDKDQNVIIMKTGVQDDDIDINIVSDEGKGFMFLNADGDEKPLFIIDGKESSEKEMKKLDPEDIKSITVIKEEKADTKYGKKGKNGVIEITTKKKNN